MAYETEIKRNADFRLAVIWKDAANSPMNLTGATGRLQFRLTTGAPVLLELTTENGGITLGGVTGTVTLLSLAATHTALPAGKTISGDIIIKNGTATDSPLEIKAVVVSGYTALA